MAELEKVIKVVLAALFFMCLLDMPYGFFMIVRTAGMIGFALLAYSAYQKGDMAHVIIYIGLVILFQPIEKIALGRTLWNIVDVGVAAYLIYTLTQKEKEQ